MIRSLPSLYGFLAFGFFEPLLFLSFLGPLGGFGFFGPFGFCGLFPGLDFLGPDFLGPDFLGPLLGFLALGFLALGFLVVGTGYTGSPGLTGVTGPPTPPVATPPGLPTMARLCLNSESIIKRGEFDITNIIGVKFLVNTLQGKAMILLK